MVDMARVLYKERDGDKEFVWVKCKGKSKVKIAKEHNVPLNSVKKLDSYVAVFTRRERDG